MKKSPKLTEKILNYIPPNACIVDIGCGDGEFLRSLTGKGYRMIGVDPVIENGQVLEKDFLSSNQKREKENETDDAEETVTTKKAVNAKKVVNAKKAEGTGSAKDRCDEPAFIKGTAEELPLPAHVADVVVMQCVFSLCDPKASIKEIKRVLKDEGLLIVTDLMSGTVSADFSEAGETERAATAEATTASGLAAEATTASGLAAAEAATATERSATGSGLGRIMTREDMESCFSSDFSLVTFSDEKSALIQMLIEAIFNDDELCISSAEQATLKKMKAGYGLWVMKKKENEI